MPERKIRAVIVDDEPLARTLIRTMLATDPEVEVIAECANAFEAIEQLSQHEADLVFLDIQMPNKDGFAVAEALGDRMPVLIFVTAFDEYALRAFEVHALDYLLKPFDRKRFGSALTRAKESLALERRSEMNQRLLDLLDERRSKGDDSGRLALKCDGRILFLRSADVEWIEAQGNYVEVHAGNSKYLIREPISALETRLDPRRFRRIQRSIIVNLDHISELQPWFRGGYKVLLRNGEELKMSDRYRQALGDCLGGRS